MAHQRSQILSNSEMQQFVKVHGKMHYEDDINDETNPSISDSESKVNHPSISTDIEHDIDETYHRFSSSHTSIHPQKHPSYSRRITIPLSYPSSSQQSKTTDFYDYIESSVIKHVNHTNSMIDDNATPISTAKVQQTLIKLKLLLLIPELDGMVNLNDNLVPNKNINANIKQHQKADIMDDKKQHRQHGIGYDYKHKHNHNHHNNNKKEEVKIVPIANSMISGKWATHSTRSLYGVFLPSSALLHHPDYSIDADKYCGILRGSVRQDWNTIETDDDEVRNWEELKPSWFELFFDLMFVAAIIHISSEVAYAYGHHQYVLVMTVFPQFGLLILCWLEQVLYFSRFRMTQRGDGLLRFTYMALVLLMGLSIGDTSNQIYQKIFLLSYMFTKLVMMIMFIKSSLIKRAHNHSVYMIIENVLSVMTVIFIEIFVNVPDRDEAVWPFIYSCLFVYSWCHKTVILYIKPIRDLGVNIPINVPHVAERMGAFVLIILGETIISIMVQKIVSTKDGIFTAYTVTMSFFVIVYCIGKLYFESQPTEHELHHHKKVHAMSTSIWRARIYKWFHILLFFALLGLGLGTKICVYKVPDYHNDDPVLVFMPGISCIIACICINVIRLTHPFDYSHEHPNLVISVWMVRACCIGNMFGVLFLWDVINHGIILGIYVVALLIQILVDFENKERVLVEKMEEEEEAMKVYKESVDSISRHDDHDNDQHDHEQKDIARIASRRVSLVGAF